MSWIEWVFSGVGTSSVIGLITYLYKKKKKEKNSVNKDAYNTIKNCQVESSVVASSFGNQTPIHTVNIYNGNHVNQSDTKAKCSKPLSKVEVPILFIDDKKFEIVTYLKNQGWTDIKRINDLRNFDDPLVIKSKIIFVDIKCVGVSLNLKGEGLELAVELKKRYPAKKIALYSSESKHNIFDKDLSLLDARIQKNADPIKFLHLVEQFMTEL